VKNVNFVVTLDWINAQYAVDVTALTIWEGMVTVLTVSLAPDFLNKNRIYGEDL
jgi:hypothetical protein